MNDRLFQRVIETIARFDTVDLLTAVAALQVMPVNITRTVRLEGARTRHRDSGHIRQELGAGFVGRSCRKEGTPEGVHTRRGGTVA